jgi:hypothetical protein
MNDVNKIEPQPYVSVKRSPSIIIETISATSEKIVREPSAEKHEILTRVPVPDGYVRCIVLIEFDGMEDKHYPGDVFDCPDRRFKTLMNRGYVRLYDGTRIPNKDR